jgi:hypothetical protein
MFSASVVMLCLPQGESAHDCVVCDAGGINGELSAAERALLADLVPEGNGTAFAAFRLA